MMKRTLFLFVALGMFIPSICLAQDDNANERAASEKNLAPVSFELDEEKLTIEADIPSVDLIISFKEIQERDNSMKASFLEEIVNSAKDEPF